ncbi:MAG: hypothetical protein JNM84_00830 [Planctomycetes bacterium]|nr:hypothetical protein [Planctomycetota bacterium]
MIQGSTTTAAPTLEDALYRHLCEGSPRPQDDAEALVEKECAALFSSGSTELDVEDLLPHYDGARLLLFSDDENLAADREYVAAYLSSARPGAAPSLALPYFSAGALQRALRARDEAPLEQSMRVFLASLVGEMGRALPPGLSDLLQIALDRGVALLGLGGSEAGASSTEAWTERLHAAALRGPVIALIPEQRMRPSWIERNFVRRGAYETVAVWQSPPALYWNLRAEQPGAELPHAVHLQSTWAFATLATHPVFRAAARCARAEDDVLLPPRPAHSARRADAPMIEMLLGAAELVRTMVQPELPAPETIRVVTFLEPELETRLLSCGLSYESTQAVLSAAERGECLAFPEHALVYLGQPRLALGLQALIRVLVQPQNGADPATAVGAREARYARIARGEALAFFSSGLIAGKRLWPEEESPADPLAPRMLSGLDRIEHALEGRTRASLVPTGERAEDDACAARVGRFLGARLLVAVDARSVEFEEACALFDPRGNGGAGDRARLIELARLALR